MDFLIHIDQYQKGVIVHKNCTTCNNLLSLNMFYKNKNNKDGYKFSCKKCELEYQRKHKNKTKLANKRYKIKNLEKIKLKHKNLRQKYKQLNQNSNNIITSLCCNKCKNVKDINYFSKNSTTKIGYNSWCKKCLKKANQLYNKNYPEQKRKDAANYRSRKSNRTPKWADIIKINEFYRNCPKGYEVDHIIPLHGNNISGLHIHTNLQYLTKEENSKKGNKFNG